MKIGNNHVWLDSQCRDDIYRERESHVHVGPKRGVLLGDPLPGGATCEFHMALRCEKRTSEEEEEEELRSLVSPSILSLLSPNFLLQ